MPKYSSDPKETTVKLRISEEMRSKIEKNAKAKGISISEYLRRIIKSNLK